MLCHLNKMSDLFKAEKKAKETTIKNAQHQ